MAAAIIAGIGAATGLAQGIFGASDAARQNSEAEDRYREQVKQQEKIAKRQTKYNDKTFEADKENYKAQRNYQFKLPSKIGNVRMRFKTFSICNLY
jgi:hypothetical protein